MRTSSATVMGTLACAAVLGGGCMETRRALGDDCLKDSDCISGICSQLRCAAPPPLLDAQIMADSAPTSLDASAAEAGPDAPGSEPEAADAGSGDDAPPNSDGSD